MFSLSRTVAAQSRTSLTFATEQITSSLAQAIQASEHGHARRPSSRRNDSDDTELDEIEIQKGLLQIGKALQFLHESAKLVHSNLTPEAVIVNAKVSLPCYLERLFCHRPLGICLLDHVSA